MELEEGFALWLRPRPATAVSLQIPADALLKFYIGQGLRQDLSHLYANQMLEKTAQVLSRHLPPKAQLSAILREINAEAA
jgi:hypothetical protein